MRIGRLFRRKKEKLDVENDTRRKLEKIDLLRRTLTDIKRNQMKLRSKFEKDLREYDRRRRAIEKRLEFCNNEIEAELHRKEIESYGRLINEFEDRLKAITTRIAKIRQMIVMLDLLERDLQAIAETKLPVVVDEFVEEFSEEEVKEFDRDLDYQLDRLFEELDRVLRNVKEREYISWLNMDIEKEKEREGVPA